MIDNPKWLYIRVMASFQKLRLDSEIKRRQRPYVVKLPLSVVMVSHTRLEVHDKPQSKLWPSTSDIGNAVLLTLVRLVKPDSNIHGDSKLWINFPSLLMLFILRIQYAAFVLLIVFRYTCNTVFPILMISFCSIIWYRFSPCFRRSFCFLGVLFSPLLSHCIVLFSKLWIKSTLDGIKSTFQLYCNFPIRSSTASHQYAFSNFGRGHLFGHAI